MNRMFSNFVRYIPKPLLLDTHVPLPTPGLPQYSLVVLGIPGPACPGGYTQTPGSLIQLPGLERSSLMIEATEASFHPLTFK